jgi:hypothetical protein
MASERVDRSGSSRNRTAVRHTARDEIFFACGHSNPVSVDD